MTTSGKVVRVFAAGASLMAGCAVAPEMAPDVHVPTVRSVPEVHLISPSVIELAPDSCADLNPNYGSYDPTRPVAKLLGVRVSHDTNVTMNQLKPEKVAQLEAGIERIYDTDVVFPEADGTEGQFAYSNAVNGTDQDNQVKSDVLQQSVEALSILPTEMVTDTEVDRYIFTPSLIIPDSTKPEGYRKIGGTYIEDSNTIIVSYGEQHLAL